MARLPQPGADSGTWGGILNDYLSQTHNADGTLKNDSVTASNLQNASVDASKLSTTAAPVTGQVLSYNGTAMAWTAAGSGGVTDHGALTGLGDDDHPQYHNDARGDARYFTQAQVTSALNTKQDSNANLAAIASLTPANDDILQRKAGAWTNRTPAQFKTDLALTKSDVGLGNVNNTADTDKPVSTAAASALAAKANDNAVVHLTGTETIDGLKTFTVSPALPAPQSNNDAATKGYVDSAVSGSSPVDASTSSKGVIQLAGDLAGTADAPTVPGLALKQNSDATLTSLAAYNTNGLLTQTAADTFTGRSLSSAGDNIVLITNGDGVGGNPTIAKGSGFDEAAQDATGAMVVSSATVNLTYTDATPELKADARTQMSITSDTNGLKLVGDASAPGNTQYYGTNGAGTKGFYAFSAGATRSITTYSSSNTLSGGTYDVVGLANATSGPLTLTLPTAVGDTKSYTVKKIDASANSVTVATSLSQTIEGAATAVVSTQYESITIVSDNANWYII